MEQCNRNTLAALQALEGGADPDNSTVAMTGGQSL